LEQLKEAAYDEHFVFCGMFDDSSIPMRVGGVRESILLVILNALADEKKRNKKRGKKGLDGRRNSYMCLTGSNAHFH
jgi:hypothetical protein